MSRVTIRPGILADGSLAPGITAETVRDEILAAGFIRLSTNPHSGPNYYIMTGTMTDINGLPVSVPVQLNEVSEGFYQSDDTSAELLWIDPDWTLTIPDAQWVSQSVDPTQGAWSGDTGQQSGQPVLTYYPKTTGQFALNTSTGVMWQNVGDDETPSWEEVGGDVDLSAYATTVAVAAGYQPLDSDLTDIAALTTTSTGRSLLTESTAQTGTGGLVRESRPTITSPQIASVGTENTLMGSVAPPSLTGIGNVTLGNIAGQALLAGNSNTCIGNKAGAALTGTGDGNSLGALNTLIGSESGANLTDGSNNVMIGQKAGVAGTTARANVIIGKSAGSSITSVQNAVYIGTGAGEFADTTGSANIAIGTSAGQYLNGTGTSSIYIGSGAGAGLVGAKNTGSYNVAIGNNAGRLTTTSTQNVLIGYQAGYSGTSFAGITAIGYQAGYSVVSGINNVYIGPQAGYSHTGARCIFIGAGAGSSVPVSSQNVCVIGGSGNERIDNYYFGEGYADASPSGYTLNATGGSGTNIAGASATIAGGIGTGTGGGGSVFISTAPAGASGATLNTLVVGLEIDDEPSGGSAETRFLLLDLTDGTRKRVSFGADDSAGVGFKYLRVAN